MLVTERTTLAAELQAVMATKGATEWSKVLDVDRTTVHKWWAGDAVPRGKQLEAIARATGRQLRFVEDQEEEEPPWAQRLGGSLEAKLNLLLATAGIDPTDAQDEKEARRLLDLARARLEGSGRTVSES